MNRTIKLGTDRLLVGGTEVIAEFNQAEVAVLALELTLLLCGLVEVVNLVSGRLKLALRVSEEQSAAAVFSRNGAGQLQCRLSRDNAEYLQHKALRAYRDGMAEVNHVHVEGHLDGSGFDLTVMFSESAPPMTPEEAETLMGK